MESHQSKDLVIWVVYTKVKSVERIEETIAVHKMSDQIVPTTIDRGWFVLFEGSWEKIFFGMDRPDFEPGDTVKITFENKGKAHA